MNSNVHTCTVMLSFASTNTYIHVSHKFSKLTISSSITTVTITIIPEIEGFSSTSLHFQLTRASTELNRMLTLGQIVLHCEQSFWYTGPSSGSTGSYNLQADNLINQKGKRSETTRTTCDYHCQCTPTCSQTQTAKLCSRLTCQTC